MPSHIQIRVDPPSGTIILNRPEKRNALSRQMLADLRQAFSDLHQQKNAQGVILTGAGDVFSAGTDLSEMYLTLQGDDPLPQWQEDAMNYRELLEEMLRFPKPIIAAVNGPALGHGAGLVLAADLVIATDNAAFGFPESKRGLVASCATPLLTFRVGGSHAANLLFTSAPIDAPAAKHIGLYGELVSTDFLWARAQELIGVCAAGAGEAISLTKRTLYDTVGEQLSMWMSTGAAASATAKTTQAAAEGIAAFLEKRAPNWP